MKELHRLTDLQLAVMDVIWSRGEATAVEVYEALVERTGLARKTIGTLLFRLEKQGILTHRDEGREYVYQPLVERSEVKQATVARFLGGLFSGDLPGMINHALQARDVEPGDLERIRALLDRWEEENG